jgi:hypothetical protein
VATLSASPPDVARGRGGGAGAAVVAVVAQAGIALGALSSPAAAGAARGLRAIARRARGRRRGRPCVVLVLLAAGLIELGLRGARRGAARLAGPLASRPGQPRCPRSRGRRSRSARCPTAAAS